MVLDEAARGDADAARRRLEKLTGIPLLEVAPEARQLADEYFAELRLPEQARPDTLHVGIASWEGVDYLVSWNMRHIANGRVMKLVREINDRHGIETPIICTPEELQEFSND